jgi:hypothetical protein
MSAPGGARDALHDFRRPGFLKKKVLAGRIDQADVRQGARHPREFLGHKRTAPMLTENHAFRYQIVNPALDRYQRKRQFFDQFIVGWQPVAHMQAAHADQFLHAHGHLQPRRTVRPA